MKNSLLTNDKEKQKNRTNTNEKNLWRKLLVDAPKVLLLMLLKIILWPCYEAKPMRF